MARPVCRVHRTIRPRDCVPSLRHAIRWIATLGGYLNRCHDPQSGATAIWRGFVVLHEITEMLRILKLRLGGGRMSKTQEDQACVNVSPGEGTGRAGKPRQSTVRVRVGILKKHAYIHNDVF